MTLLIEWDEESAIRLAETVWNAGGRVYIAKEAGPNDESDFGMGRFALDDSPQVAGFASFRSDASTLL